MFDFLKRKPQGEKITCPKCLKTVELTNDAGDSGRCAIGLRSGCYQPFPIRYVRDFSTAETLPIQVFGWAGHGKTVFLDALRLTLLDMRKVWPEYTFQSISELDMGKERELRGTLRLGKMPPSTQKISKLSDLQVYVMKLENIMNYRHKWLIVMDYPGELFEEFSVNAELMPFLVGSHTTFFIMSIPMVNNMPVVTEDGRQPDVVGLPEGKSIDQLMNTYLETMLRIEEQDKQDRKRKHESFKLGGDKRQVIVVLTMADALLGDMPAEIRKYLQSDNLWSRLRSPSNQPFTQQELDDYYAGMADVSNQIREWLLTDSDGAPGGANLVGLLENSGVTVRYSMISAVGFKPHIKAMKQETKIDDPTLMPVQPKRVIDPFLWALKFDKQIKS